MKRILIPIIIVTLVCLLCYWGCQHIESYQARATVIDKTMTQSRDGDMIRYYVIYVYGDGEIDEREVTAEFYYKAEIGNVYLIKQNRWK